MGLLKVLGVQAADFSAYYDLVQALRARRIPFVALGPDQHIPPQVGVLITTGPPRVSDALNFSFDEVVVVAFQSVERTIDEALRALNGTGPMGRCVIGIDPGERPGIAVLSGGRILRVLQAGSPESVREHVEDVFATFPAESFLIRIGNGAPTFRNRILQMLAGLPVMLEVVDERHSTPVGYHGNGERDTQAATRIALTSGQLMMASEVGPVRPTPGELRDIQRKSRLESEGRLTISRALARYVALGRLTLAEAVRQQGGGIGKA